jgi:hypothetical protein
MTLAGFVIAVVFYKARNWQWHDGVLTCIAAPDTIWGRPNAQTLGWLEIYDTEDSRNEVDIRVHENVHIVQAFFFSLLALMVMPVLFAISGFNLWLGLALGGFVGGLGFAALYGILFMYFLLTQKAGWYEAYMANPFEKQAYTMQDKYIQDPTSRPWGV